MSSPLAELQAAVTGAAAALRDGADRSAPAAAPALSRPKQQGHGDYATNAAMLLAPVLAKAPREIAGELGEVLAGQLGPALERYEVAGPGFLNLFLSDAWHRAALAVVLSAGDAFGAGGAAQAERVLVEFVSANPTGPMHVGHSRNAAYGDSLARILGLYGHEVAREYYVNDFGSQVRLFGASLQARARGEAPPEGGYQGDYVAELAAEIDDAAGRPVEDVAREGVALMLARIESSLERFRVGMHRFFSEASLHEGGPSAVDRAFARLEELGTSYRSEGALWLRTTPFGDDKDRVIERATGEHTYFASDIAYMQDKRDRGFDRLMYVLGADHHGYVHRMKAAYQTLGRPPEEIELLIMQFVHLVERGGGRSSMSKRSGDFVTHDELLDLIGVDAARWYLLARSHDTTIDLDVELAQRQSAENPVYYVQYAHARISGVLAKAGGPPNGELPEVALAPAERTLVKRLLAFPGEVAEAADRRAPHRIATYALELAQDFTRFYDACKIVGAPEGAETERLRLALCVATQATIARSLGLLGISAPEQM